MERKLILQELLDDSTSSLVNNSAALMTNAINTIASTSTNINKKRVRREITVKNFYENTVQKYSDREFRTYFRMTRNTIQKLVDYLTEKEISTSNYVKVPMVKKVHITIWVLANKSSFREVANLFGLHKSTINYIFLNVCKILARNRRDFIKWPDVTKQEEISRYVEEHHKFPNCVGFIDGCHIQIKAPFNNNVDFYNRKQTHSVVLQATCDHSLQFTDVYIGQTGRAHDARIFRESQLGQLIKNLIDKDHHILGDSAYTLSVNVLTPFRDNGHLTPAEVQYNKVHSASRSYIERAFGKLKSKFRRLHFLDMNRTKDIPIVICAACVIHNFIIQEENQGNYNYNNLVREPIQTTNEAIRKRRLIVEHLFR